MDDLVPHHPQYHQVTGMFRIWLFTQFPCYLLFLWVSPHIHISTTSSQITGERQFMILISRLSSCLDPASVSFGPVLGRRRRCTAFPCHSAPSRHPCPFLCRSSDRSGPGLVSFLQPPSVNAQHVIVPWSWTRQKRH